MRVIDVSNQCLIDAPPDCGYLALSYVCGQDEQIQLSKESLAGYKTPGAVEQTDLPRTSEDAMFLIRKLG